MNIGNVIVVSKRRGGTPAPAGARIVDIDRTDPVLNNPFRMNDDTDAERARVIELHRKHVAYDVQYRLAVHQRLDALAQAVANGETLALRCWCAPRACHGDLYRSIIMARARDIALQKRP